MESYLGLPELGKKPSCRSILDRNRAPENQHAPSTFAFTEGVRCVRSVDYAVITVFLVVDEIL